MKKLASAGLAFILLLACSTGALAMEVPVDATVQNLNGSQQYIKTYTVSPETDPASLIEEPFSYEGFTYTYASMTKRENRMEDERRQIETVTVETAKKDLAVVLAALSPTLEYDDGLYHGTLNLDHTSIVTEATGYESRSYTVSDTKTYESLPSNDMAYISATAVKDGVTLNLLSVDWQVQATALVDDVLMPSLYRAVASYSSKAWYSAATGYITTAEYAGNVVCSGVESVTYTLTYLGAETITEPELPAAENDGEGGEAPAVVSLLGGHWRTICGVIGLAAILVLAVLLFLSRREIARLRTGREEIVDADYEETEEPE